MTALQSNALQFSSYNEFFAFYLRAHSHPLNRVLHFCGSLIGLAVAITAIALGHPWFVLLWPVIGYGFAWFGHFVFEKNTPTIFKHPATPLVIAWAVIRGLGAGLVRLATPSRRRLPHGLAHAHWTPRPLVEAIRIRRTFIILDWKGRGFSHAVPVAPCLSPLNPLLIRSPTHSSQNPSSTIVFDRSCANSLSLLSPRYSSC